MRPLMSLGSGASILQHHRSLGIQARLVILVLMTVLPLVGLASFTSFDVVGGERARMQRDVKNRVETLLGPDLCTRKIQSLDVFIDSLVMIAKADGRRAGPSPRRQGGGCLGRVGARG